MHTYPLGGCSFEDLVDLTYSWLKRLFRPTKHRNHGHDLRSSRLILPHHQRKSF